MTERNHALLREFRLWQMRRSWFPPANLATRRGRWCFRTYSTLERSLAWAILRLPLGGA